MYQGNIRNLFIGRGLQAGFTSPCAITIYGGVQPTAAAITSAWTSYNQPNANFLAHYVGGSWTQPSGGLLLQLTTLPPAVLADHTGTGTWAILWATNVSAVVAAGASLPNASFIVVPVSNSFGPGVVRFTDPTTFVAGVSKAVLDGSIGAFITP